MTDLSNQINLFSSRINEQLEKLESEYRRWTNYKHDYDALEVQLKSLPDTTTKTAMIPIGKLAFMPGKIIHTNEILVLLGDQYYAERSAKQAVDILQRRREVVVENMRLAEAELNSFRAKKEALKETSGSLTPSGQQLNEEGLPIMEIREELPPVENKPIEAKKEPVQQEGLPESVLRARAMMKEADEKMKDMLEDKENKALFDLLLVQFKVKESSESTDDGLDSDIDEEEDDRYDTEIAENMFDRFGDDEEYGLDGTVDQEDFTHYEQEKPFDSEEDEKSTPKVITKKKAPPKTTEEQPMEKTKEPQLSEKTEEPPKKMSRFKLAQQEKKKALEPIVKEADTEDTPNQDKPKKFSKFKLLRQEQKERLTKSVVTEKVPALKEVPIVRETKEEDNDLIEPKSTADRQIPQVETTKKPSRFKAEQTRMKQAVAIEKPKRTVTWDTTTSVRDHDSTHAPSVVSETASYSQPIKSDMIRSPADIFNRIKQQVDDYPSLDTEDEGQPMDLNELIKAARDNKEVFYGSTQGTETLIQPIHQEGIMVAKKSKLDNKIMKGAVMERDSVPVDLEQVQDDMDLREISSGYQQKRQNMLAATVPRKISRFKAARLGMKDQE
ncbi:uri1, prefoldin-like chaperone, partial [Rhizopus stolonifer]